MNDDGVLFVADADLGTVLFEPRRVTLPDGATIAHESQGGTLASVTTVDHGEFFLEIAHLGDGPVGGELVMSVTRPAPGDTWLLIGDLWTEDEPTDVPPSWPVAVDLALGLVAGSTTILSPTRVVEKEELEALHQRLLAVLYA